MALFFLLSVSAAAVVAAVVDVVATDVIVVVKTVFILIVIVCEDHFLILKLKSENNIAFLLNFGQGRYLIHSVMTIQLVRLKLRKKVVGKETPKVFLLIVKNVAL